MRYTLLFLLGIALLCAGCTGSQPATTAPATTCADYCPTLQHANCTGAWAASGTYPSCTCTFNCVAANPPANQTPPPANVTPPPQNVSPPANQSPPANVSTPALPATNKTVSQLLSDALDSGRSEFYKNNDGSFQENAYTWLRGTASPPSGEIQLTAPATDVKFNGAAISSIEASGFTVFTDKDTAASSAYGVAIFRANSTPLDTLTDTFSVDYFEPVISKNLRNCAIWGSEQNVDSTGSVISTYLFRCYKIVDK